MRQHLIHASLAVCAAGSLGAQCNLGKQTTVPDPSKDRAPAIAISGIVSGPGRVSAVTSTASGTVYATNPTTVVLTASATNPGGVASLSLVVDEAGRPGDLYHVTATSDPAQVPDKLDVFTTAPPDTAPIRIVVTECEGTPCNFTEFTVVASATNFNGQTSTVTLRYLPLGGTSASLTASPSQITQGSSSTLTWSTSDTTAPVTLDGAPVADSGTKTVTPSSTTTYTLVAKSPFFTASATATVAVTPKTPPPGPASLSLAYEFPGVGQQGFPETAFFVGTLTSAADPNDTTGATSFQASVPKRIPPPGGDTPIQEWIPTTIPGLRRGTWRVEATGSGGFAGAVTCHGIAVPQAFGQAQLSVFDSSGPSCTCSPPCAVGP